MTTRDPDVLVLGAGPAGLSAARTLADAGRSVVVLEAADRVGGRIHTVHVPDLGPVELGAEFVHGDAPHTTRLMRAARIRRRAMFGRFYEAGPGGPVVSEGDFSELGEVLSQMQAEPDRSLTAAIAAVQASPEAKGFAMGFLTGFDALDPDRASTRAILLEEGSDPGGGAMNSHLLAGGQDALLGPLCAGLTIHTRTVVQRVAHRADRVTVHATDPLGRPVTYSSPRAIIALPLGVLQSGAVTFDPPLAWPIHAVASGSAIRVILQFSERFWDALAPRLGFLRGSGESFVTFWADRKRPLITAWAGGPPARALEGIAPQERATRAARDLALALGMPLDSLTARLCGWYHHDWDADPLARGAYSYVAVGGVDLLPALREPIGALMLAGEYVPGEGVSATVEAALASGAAAGRWGAS